MKVTPRDKEVLKCIGMYINEHKYPPSYEEIGKACGMKSKSSVYGHVRRLLTEGVLETDHKGCPRAYRVVQKEQ